MTTLRVATFTVEDLHLAIDIVRVQEVLHTQSVTHVPLAHPAVRGLLNLRGQIATAVEARHRLGLSERTPPDDGVHFVVPSDGVLMTLIVDREGDVIDLDSERFDVPPTVNPQIRSLVTGVYQWEGSLLLMVDVDQMLSVTGS